MRTRGGRGEEKEERKEGEKKRGDRDTKREMEDVRGGKSK